MTRFMLTRESILLDTCLQCPRLQEIFFKALSSFSSLIFSSLAFESFKLDGEGKDVYINLSSGKQLYNSMECFTLANITAIVLFSFVIF